MPKEKPSAKPPIWWHVSGQWTKKHKGKQFYFGGGSLSEGLRRYEAEWPRIIAGLPRRESETGDGILTVQSLVNVFLTAKRNRVRSGELSEAAWSVYHRISERMVTVLGASRDVRALTAADFGRLRADGAQGREPTTLNGWIARARAIFDFGGKIVKQPPDYGDQFNRVSRRVLRLARQTRPPKLLAAAELRKLLEVARPDVKAQILLGLNCGYGAADCSNLTRDALTRRPGWLTMLRHKTGASRLCPLWPETVAAIAAAQAVRPAPHDPADGERVFLTRGGYPCVHWTKSKAAQTGGTFDAIGRSFREVCAKAGVVRPNGAGFYLLRHVFRTVADEVHDRPAIDLIMGHADETMAAHYRESIDETRFHAVVGHVREWLWPTAKKAGKK
jgi:hypothetical protein